MRNGWRLSLALLAASALVSAHAQTPAASKAAPAPAPTTQASTTPQPQVIKIAYIELKVKRTWPEAYLDQPPDDEGVQGAKLGLADDKTTGRFTGQDFTMDVEEPTTPAGVIAAFKKLAQEGERSFVIDAPPDLLLKLADLPEAKDTLIIDAADPDDRLRGADCRANVLHVLPSRSMLADALMQYLVVKNWTRIMLVTGKTADDKLYADAIRKSAHKFQVRITADKPWTFNPANQQADTGHFEINTEVAKLTQDESYDVLVVADEEDNFGDDLSYRTFSPRPVAGTQGLVPEAWARSFDEYAATQFQGRFLRQAHRWMTVRDYGAWVAVRTFGEAAIRTHSADPKVMDAYIRSPKFQLGAYKGEPMSFRPWDGQMRQPILLADDRSLVSISPQPGFLHQFFDTDTLGVDQPETTCHMH